MKRKLVTTLTCTLVLLVGTVAILMAADIHESEPNDTPANADPLTSDQTLFGAIDPVGDVDYYSLAGVNTTWGFIALLDTTNASDSDTAVLDALGSDGVTVLQSDAGSWENGSGIALQSYADGNVVHYLRVTEAGDNEIVDDYRLRYYKTVIVGQPEIEPNDSHTTGTPSAFTHDGVVNPAGDVDCFVFHGRVGYRYLFALNSDPENDGTTANLVLELRDPSGTVLKRADVSASGGNEFIQYESLALDGAYAYCVYEATGGGSSSATYKVGLVQNEQLYFPGYDAVTMWLDPKEGGFATEGDDLTFRFAITNTSPITIPGEININTEFDDNCLSLVNATPTPTSTSSGYVSWYGQKVDLAPGEVYTTTVVLKAEASCTDDVRNDIGLPYYLTGTSRKAAYTILGESVYLPAILRSQ